jgi:putative peptidoglycan lipid II flippase
MKLVKAMATVAGMTGLSRIAGFVRDVVTAYYVGAGPVSDAFFVALKLPNLFRRVTAEGAFSIAFVPMYTEKLEKEGEVQANHFAGNAFMVMLSWLSVFTFLIILAMPHLMLLIAPGFDDPDRISMAVEFSQITFPYLLFMSLASLLGGVLNAHDRFAPFAFAPTLFNLSMLASLFLSHHFETAGHAMSWGLMMGGVLQLAFLWACMKRARIRMPIVRPKVDGDVKRLLKLMLPAMVGAGVVHINLFADIMMASFLGEGAISYLFYADRLNQLPLGMVGIAVGTALLPMLSRTMTQGDKVQSVHLFNRAMECCLVLALPSAVALGVMPLTLMTVLFQRGEFTAIDSQMSAQILTCYAIGLPAYICIKVFSTAHWARQDTTTPVRISIVITFLNILLGVIFMQFWGVIGIALATGLVAWVQFYMNIIALRDHPSAHFDEKFMRNAPCIVVASVLMGLALWGLTTVFHGMIFEGSTLEKVAALGVTIAAGGGLYGAVIFMTGVLSVADIKRYFMKKAV